MRMPPLGVSAVAVAVVAAGAVGYALGLGPGADASAAVVTTPMAWIDNLSDGDVLPIGTHVVNSHAAAPEGIASMTLDVNGERQTEERDGNTLERVDWGFDAPEPGDYLISVWGTTSTGAQTPLSTVNVLVIDTDELTPVALPSGAGSESAAPELTPADDPESTPAPDDPAWPTTPAPVPAPTTTATTPTPTATPPSPTASPPSPTPSASPTPSPTPTSSPTPTPNPTPTPSPTPTPNPTPTPSPTPTGPCTPSAPVLQSPSDGSSIQFTPATLTWSRTGTCEPELWQVQLSLAPDFTPAEYDDIISADQDQYTTESLETCETWYWRVRGINETGDGPWSQTYRFTVFIRGC